ncbi:hypothetical protein HID58_069792, partial [Brassica napus]
WPLQAECCQEAFPVLENSKCEERWRVNGLHLVLLERKTNQSFCHSDSPVSIRFTDQAKFHELPENKGLIPMELF